jgi:hypothetical protein
LTNEKRALYVKLSRQEKSLPNPSWLILQKLRPAFKFQAARFNQELEFSNDNPTMWPLLGGRNFLLEGEKTYAIERTPEDPVAAGMVEGE